VATGVLEGFLELTRIVIDVHDIRQHPQSNTIAQPDSDWPVTIAQTHSGSDY
jgi:hypothetical protein